MKSKRSIALLGIVLVLVACGPKAPKTIKNVPPNINQQEVKDWYTATGSLEQVSEMVKAATTLTIKIHNTMTATPAAPTTPCDANCETGESTLKAASIFDGPKYVALLKALGHVNQGGIHAAKLLTKAPENFPDSTKLQVLAFTDDALGELQVAQRDLLSGIEDGPSQQKMIEAVSGIRTVLMALRLVTQIQQPQPTPAVQ